MEERIASFGSLVERSTPRRSPNKLGTKFVLENTMRPGEILGLR
jgi:hypothetical protein